MPPIRFARGDFAARFGGEEFVVLLPDTPIAGALLMAEKIRAAVRSLEIDHGDSQADRCVTLSLGVSQVMPAATLTSAALLHAADMALYQAKKQGRNRTVLQTMEAFPLETSLEA
ncbi:MAG: GGDEF domain-containing protein [Coprothermobacterota bacterium]|nr:GGDEF domain-containing protein [Coprothermobacterota bacterium]